MPIDFAGPCPICKKDVAGEAHLECVALVFASLSPPAEMEPIQRFDEVRGYRNYPPGWPLDLLQTRVEALIGRPLNYKPAPSDWTDSIKLSAWVTENETLPSWNDKAGWVRLAEEARTHQFPILVEGE